jgi:uncharacterized protein with ATP-grasp and redox domains
MKSWEREIDTHFQMIDRFIDLTNLDSARASIIKKELRRYMEVRLRRGFWMDPQITEFHTEWYREFYRICGVPDPYQEIKRKSDELAREILASIEISDFRDAVVASIIANRLDFGAYAFDKDKMPVDLEHFSHLQKKELQYDDFDSLVDRIGRSRVLLYLVDNHGEVLFDKKVIEMLTGAHPQCEIVVAGKSAPMLNDVTYDGLRELGFDEVARVIPTGSNCFGIPHDDISIELAEVLKSADLIISKGQAYLEYWMDHYQANVYSLAYTKFPVSNVLIGEIPAGQDIILSFARYSQQKTSVTG